MNAGKFRKKWTPRQLAHALQQIAEDDGPNYQRASDIPYLSLLTRASTDTRFKLLLDAAIEVRRQRHDHAKQQARRRDAMVIIEQVGSGTPIKAACKATGLMSAVTFHAFIKHHSDLRKMLDEASQALRRASDSERWRFLSNEQIDDAAALVRAGFSLDAAFAKVAPDVTVSQRTHFLKREAWAREAIDDAIRCRESGNRATGRTVYADRPQWQEADYTAALTAIAFARGKAIRAVLQPPLMSYIAVYHRAQRDDKFAERLAQAVTDYRTARRLKKSKVAKAAKPVFETERLRTSLMHDDLYREASAAISTRIDPDLRDDFITELIVAVLQGDLAREDIKTQGAAFGRKYLGKLNRRGTDTLDRPIGYDGTGALLVDTITSDHWSWEGA